MRWLTFAILFLSLEIVPAQSLWLRYPAISPDGKTIAFTHNADLYTVSSKGGLAVPLTQHVSRDFHPVWSPDGKHLAFASNRHGNYDVYLISIEGGEPKRLTFHSQNDIPSAFTPDGASVIFDSTRIDSAKSLDIPNRRIGELYQVPVAGGRVTQILTTPAERVDFSPDGNRFLYYDRKGYEDVWRKHHVSSVTRDVWLYNSKEKSHRKLTSFPGEDRDPVWLNNETFAYLSEQSGSFNLWVGNVSENSHPKQITKFKDHPIRFLTVSDEGLFCFGYDGQIYLKNGFAADARPVPISIRSDQKTNDERITFSDQITEMAVSPDGEEIAFIARGEIFVTSIDHKTTRQITDTAEQERSVSFHPDGRQLVYASERDNSWNLYLTKIERKDEENFFLATALKEEELLVSEAETFQPSFSPDGKRIAYLSDRTELCVLNLEDKSITRLHDGSRSFSYKDGDIEFSWSPDGKNLLTALLQDNRWTENIYLVSADGMGLPTDLSRNGYYDYAPQWSWNGEAAIWVSNRHGRKAHGSWGSDLDVYAGFLTDRAHRLFQLSEAERDEIDEEEWKKMFDSEAKLDVDGIEDRIVRLTPHSTDLAGAVISHDGRKIYYLGEERDEYQLWEHDFYTKDTTLMTVLGGGNNGYNAKIHLNADGDKIFLLAGGTLYEIETESGDWESLSFDAEMTLRRSEERSYMFEHVWRQVREKFHRKDFHGVDWDFYKKEYQKFLPAIDNNYDFTEMLSEMLGELDASHTGASYRPKKSPGDSTASLGIFYDDQHNGPGIKILEVIDRSPLALLDRRPVPGTIIEKINGIEIPAGRNFIRDLNRLEDQRTLLSFFDPGSGDRWEAVVKPISLRQESELLYRRWLERMRDKTEELSGGRLGYVHVRGMNDSAFREVFSKVFGYYSDCDGLIVDTRFNGGGWLTEDLTTFLSGKQFLKFYPRGQRNLGGEPIFRWTKSSAVIMGEGNYSDAHLFPYAYKALEIGKLVGMPVPGTGTAVWWEKLIDRSITFGIPQVSTIDTEGNYLENTQLEPDIKVENTPENRAAGNDRQLQEAVKHLLSLPAPKPWPLPKPE